MKTLIIGANGKIGRRISNKMTESSDFEPTAFIRKAEQRSYFESINVPTLVKSLEKDVDELKEAFKGYDAVVFTAGSGASTGADKTIEVDLYGAVKAIEAAKANDVNRFVMVSAAYSDEPSFWSDSMKPYYIAKHMADKELKRSGLEYTILRPVGLTDKDEAGKIKIEEDPRKLSKEIPREAVAESVLEVLRNSSTSGKILEMSEGDQEIAKAVGG